MQVQRSEFKQGRKRGGGLGKEGREVGVLGDNVTEIACETVQEEGLVLMHCIVLVRSAGE
jgi:hypothetical protein